MDDVRVITSPEAIALYKKNEFIRAKDILSNPSLIGIFSQTKQPKVEPQEVKSSQSGVPIEEVGKMHWLTCAHSNDLTFKEAQDLTYTKPKLRKKMHNIKLFYPNNTNTEAHHSKEENSLSSQISLK